MQTELRIPREVCLWSLTGTQELHLFCHLHFSISNVEGQQHGCWVNDAARILLSAQDMTCIS